MSHGPAAVALGLLAVLAGALDAADPRAAAITVVGAGRPAAEVLGMARAALAPDALDAGDGYRPVAMAALRAPPEAAWQALAHALDLRWQRAGNGEALLLRGDALVPGQPSARTWPGAGPRPLALESAVRHLLAPWLTGSATGLAIDPMSGAWSATLDRDGMDRLDAVVNALDQGDPRIPAWIRPDPPAGAHPAMPGGAWADLAAALVDAGAPAVGVHPTLLAATAPALAAGPWVDLPGRLGVPAAWIDGALCIGAPRPRRHPAQAAVVAVLPVGHLRRSAAEVAAVVAPLLARRPGWGALPHPEGSSLVLVADPETIHAIMDLMTVWERDEGLLAP